MIETFDQSNMFGINGAHKHCDSRNGAASSLFPSRRPHLRAGSYDVRSFRRLVRLRFSIHLSIHATYKSRHSLAWCRLGHHDFCFFHQSFLPVSISCVFSSHLTFVNDNCSAFTFFSYTTALDISVPSSPISGVPTTVTWTSIDDTDPATFDLRFVVNNTDVGLAIANIAVEDFTSGAVNVTFPEAG